MYEGEIFGRTTLEIGSVSVVIYVVVLVLMVLMIVSKNFKSEPNRNLLFSLK